LKQDFSKFDFGNSHWNLPENFYSCLDAKGLYSTTEFVLRLRPDLHRTIAGLPEGGGIITGEDLTFDHLLAFSTFFHENIHWWQHVGSVSGLILSLLYPTQTHVGKRHLENFLKTVGPTKSITECCIKRAKLGLYDPKIDDDINLIVNKWHDIEFYRFFIVDPLKADRVLHGNTLFENLGVTYSATLSDVVWVISSIIDPKLEILPDPRKWESELIRLKNSKTTNFWYGSPRELPKIGAREIFEGQACFSQAQYIALTLKNDSTWSYFEDLGIFHGVYIAAFDQFLNITKFKRPEKLDDPLVGLFLLICDISINPTEGFLNDIKLMQRFIENHDPGWRFQKLCIAVMENPQKFESAITRFSAQEYKETVKILCELSEISGPLDVMEIIKHWSEKNDRVKDLLEENRQFSFKAGNLPIRVLLARFMRLQIDKTNHPEFFCWPGVWMTTNRDGEISPEKALEIFNEHRALFADNEDGNVYPSKFQNRSDENIEHTFHSFYGWIPIYELTRQWIISKGPFNYNFLWLTSNYSQLEMQEWASEKFETFYGVHPDVFQI
jgi:hypothetical protein